VLFNHVRHMSDRAVSRYGDVVIFIEAIRASSQSRNDLIQIQT